MQDPRYQQLAKILVEQCLRVQPEEHIWIRVTAPVALPLAREVYKCIVLAGAFPLYDIGDDQVTHFFYKHATPAQLNHKPELMEWLANRADKTVTLVGEMNTRELAGVDPKKMLERSVLMKPVKKLIMSKPWVLSYMPTPAMAQDANQSFEEFEDFFFGTTNRDWLAVETHMAQWAQRLTGTRDLHIVGEQTDLHMSVVGKTWISNDWQSNMPGGEVFTSPIADSVEGEVYFNYPLLRDGRLIRDIHLVFERGRVVRADASENQEFLEHILNTDSDARRLGEIALGGNPGVTQYMYNMLFDEKMAGTIHMALGQGFADCGGETNSAIHMDIVKDMRPTGSQIFLDGELFLDAGKILI
jgi:aminopeptidase